METGFVPMFSPYEFDADDISHRVTIKTEEEKQKNVKESIDVTKALMLMGFGSWKNLEPENDKENFKEMEEKLSKVFEEKLSDRRDYLDMIVQIRGNKDDLYKKMEKIGEKRADALFVDKDNTTAQPPKDQKSPDHPHQTPKDVQQNLRRTKSQKGSRKGGHNKGGNHPNKMNGDNSNVTQEKDYVQQDDEVVALTWAYKTLNADIKRRREKHKKSKKIDLKKMQKMQAYLRFKMDLEERSKPEVETNCWNVTDAQQNNDNNESSTPTEKKNHIRNITQASSIISFMQNAANTKENGLVEGELAEEPLDENIDDVNPNGQQPKEKEKKGDQVIHMKEDQGDDAQKIIDKIMPKRVSESDYKEAGNTKEGSHVPKVKLGELGPSSASNTNLGNASLDANKNIRPSPKQSPKHEMPVEKEFQRNASIRKSKTGTKNKVIKPSSDPSKLAKGHGSGQGASATQKDGKKSFKGVTKSNVLGDMSDAFAEYVQQNLNQQGFRDLSEDEQRVILSAIKATLTQDKVLETFQVQNKPSKNAEVKNTSKKKRRHSSNKAP